MASMTSADIRQSFLDFFARHEHTIVPSSSLLPSSPGLLFTNAGMNQFVPIFLGERRPDVARWAGVQPGPGHPRRRHPEMHPRRRQAQRPRGRRLRHLPPHLLRDARQLVLRRLLQEGIARLGLGTAHRGLGHSRRSGCLPRSTSPTPPKATPSEFDQEAHDIWAGIFTRAGLDPSVHIVTGGKKDNFWMMGDTGPCGPVLRDPFQPLALRRRGGRPRARQRRPAACIEIWNHVFIQFNANADGTFSPLAARHVDTGMGFERVAGIHATTKGFTDFAAEPSNYAAELFRGAFRGHREVCGQRYGGTVPATRDGLTADQRDDRHRLPRPRRPRALRVLRDRRRHPAGQRRPQLRRPPDPPPRASCTGGRT